MRGKLAVTLMATLVCSPLMIAANDAAPPPAFTVALRTLHHGDPATAVRQFEHYRGGTEQAPSVEVEYLLGRAYLAAGQPDKARVALRAVTDSSFVLADYARLHLGEAQLADDDPDAAAATFNSLLIEYPDSIHAKRTRLLHAHALAAAKRHAEAAALYVAVESQGRGDESRESLLLRAALESEAAGTTADAILLLLRVWRDFPETAESHVAEARLEALEAAGHKKAASRKTFAARYYRALALSGQGKKTAALAELNTLKKRYPRSLPGDFELRRGYIFFRLKRYKESRAVLSRGLKWVRSPRVQAEMMFWQARANSRMGNIATARRQYRNLHQLHPKNKWAKKGLYYSGLLSMDEGEWKQAAKDFQYYLDAFPRTRDADEVVWWQAWCYYRMRWYKSADKSFKYLTERYPRSSLVKRATYWRARIALHQNRKKTSARLFVAVERSWPHTYYGMLASSVASQLAAEDPAYAQFVVHARLDPRLAPTPRAGDLSNDAEGPCDDERGPYGFHVARAEVLVRLGFENEAAGELRMARTATSTRACLLDLAKVSLDAGDFHGAQYIARTHLGDELTVSALNSGELELWHLAYPKAYKEHVEIYSGQYGFDPSLLWALMREESTFLPDVVSPVGAIGLLQIMPYTGDTIAGRLGIKEFDSKKLYDPEINIGFSAWYVNGLLGRWGGNEALAIASYNGGPHAVERWMKEGPELDPDEFIEEIGYSETRRYVKRVLRSYGMYERLYGKGTPQFVTGDRMERTAFVSKPGAKKAPVEPLAPGHPNYPDF